MEDTESLKVAMKDAYAVFAVTNWQEVLDKDKEIAQGKRLADVAKVVFSSVQSFGSRS